MTSNEHEKPALDTIYDVIVIGAGWSGLVSAKTYLQVTPTARLLIIDSDSSVGGTWSKKRLYPNLQCEAGWGLFHFSDLVMDNEGIGEQGWIPGAAVHRYLTQYATRFDLHKRMLQETSVRRVERQGSHDNRGRWRLTISPAASRPQILTCHKLIIATGLTSRPLFPSIPRHDFGGPVYHSKDMGLPTTQDALSGPFVQNVTVYGGSKSAFEAVYYLIQAGKNINWIIRPDGGGPSLMTPLKMLGFLSSFKLNNTRFFGVFSPNPFDTSSIWNTLFHGPRRLFIADFVVMTFWRVTTWMMSQAAEYDRSSNGAKLKPKLGLDSSFWSPATLGVMTCPGLWDAIHTRENIHVHRHTVVRMAPKAVELDDGSRIPSDAFIFATGWEANHDIFPAHEHLDLGLPSSSKRQMEPATPMEKLEEIRLGNVQAQADRFVVEQLPLLARSPPGFECNPTEDYRLYRFLVPVSDKYADRSIAYVGFLRNTGLPIVLEAQALWATAYLLGDINVPRREQREQDAARTSAWIRRRYVCGRKVPFALVDWFPYIDLLYGDLGVCSRRKANWFAETFALYKPEEFRGIVDEWKAQRRSDIHPAGNSPTRRSEVVVIVLLFAACVVLATLLSRAGGWSSAGLLFFFFGSNLDG